MTYLAGDNIITSLGSTTEEVISNIEKEITGINHNHSYSKYTAAPISLIDYLSIQEEIVTIFPETEFTRFESLASSTLDIIFLNNEEGNKPNSLIKSLPVIRAGIFFLGINSEKYLRIIFFANSMNSSLPLSPFPFISAML